MADIRINTATAGEVAAHLASADDAFVPRLSERVAIPAYARKIVGHAQRFEAWEDGALVGLVAAYLSPPDARSAFITSVSVLPRSHGRGIGSRLLERCIAYAVAQACTRITLEVDPRNQRAVDLYRKLGFVDPGRPGTTIMMELALPPAGEDGDRT